MQQPIGFGDDVGHPKLLAGIRPQPLRALDPYTDRSRVHPITHHPPIPLASLILSAVESHAKVVAQPYGAD